MRNMAVLALAVVLSVGLAMSYIMYRQLGTGTITLEASPRLERNGEGALCGDVDFVVAARRLGRWMLRTEKGQTISGVVAVDGGDDLDIGLSIWAPTNRRVFYEPERLHRQEFEVAATIRGDYRFEFDNRHSTFMQKRVRVSLCLA